MNAKLRHLVNVGLRISATKWLILGSLVGVICGVAGLIFYVATDVGAHLVLTSLAGYHPDLPKGEAHLLHSHDHGGTLRWWWLLICLPLGGLISGLIVERFAKDARGAGTEAAIHAYHHERGIIKLRSSITKFFASVITLSSGGSAGREGPIAMVGAGFASWLAQRLGLSSRDRRILLTAGIAGGVAAIFRAPLAGVLFAAEVVYSDPDVEADGLIPGFISAIVGYVTFGMLESLVFVDLQSHIVSSLFLPPDGLGFATSDAIQLVGYLLVAVSVVLATKVIVASVQSSERAFQRLAVPAWVRPGIGGALTACIALLVLGISWWTSLVPEGETTALATLGAGYGVLQNAMDGQLGGGGTAVALLMLIAMGKLATTCCTVSSGGSGGLFGPTIVIGGCVGGAVGFALQGFAIAPPPAACIIMGMAGCFSATFKVPIASLLMVSEMTGNYELLLPAMWVCALSYLLSGRRGVVHSQVSSPIASPAHRGHFFNDILGGIRVRQVFDPDRRPVKVLKPHSSIDACKELVAQSHQTVYPIVDDHGKLCGIFNLNDLRSFLFDDNLALVAVAQDVALDTGEIIAISPHDSLATALRRFTQKNLEELPVVADDDPEHFLGLLTRREVIAYYNQVVDELRAHRKAEGWAQDE